MRLRLLFLCWALALALFACAVVVGIEDRPLREDAADTGAVDAAPPVDPCVHASPPSAPAADDDSEERDFTTAVRTFRYADTAGAVGLDVDDSCTCVSGPGARNDGGASCIGEGPACDRDGGIDNALLDIQFLQLAGAQDEALSKEVACGHGGLVLRLFGYNGRANDTSVALGFLPAIGALEPHEDAEAPAQCDGGALVGKSYAPRWDGTDRFNPDDRYVGSGGTPAYLLKAYVRDFTVVATATGILPLPIGPSLADTVQARVVARIVPLDSARNPITPVTAATRAESIRLEGVLAGRGSVTAMMKVVERTRLGGSFVCPGSPLWQEVKSSLCTAADIRANPAEDFRGQRCDGISLALGFVAEPALQGSAAANTSTPSTCPDTVATCD